MDRNIKELIDGSQYGKSVREVVKLAERDDIQVSMYKEARGGIATFTFLQASYSRGPKLTVDYVEDLIYGEGFDINNIWMPSYEKDYVGVDVTIMIDTPDIQDWLYGN